MSNSATQAVGRDRSLGISKQVLLVVGASLLMAICGRLSVPLPFTPIPLTLANLGLLFVALTLGSRRAAAAMLLYLAEGAMGLPVFSPAGPGGIAQLLGPTGGYLMAYPVAAFVAGLIAEQGKANILRYSVAAFVGQVLLFVGGVSWLTRLTGVPISQAVHWGVYPFAVAEVVKITAAIAAAMRVNRSAKV